MEYTSQSEAVHGRCPGSHESSCLIAFSSVAYLFNLIESVIMGFWGFGVLGFWGSKDP